MAPKPETPAASSLSSTDPIYHILRVLPYDVLRHPPRPPHLLPRRLRFCIRSHRRAPPGIGSSQDPSTGSVRPVVFLPGHVNGEYIIEGLSSGFMFLLGGIGIILMDLALDKNRSKSVKVSFATAGVSSVAFAYAMSMMCGKQAGEEEAEDGAEAQH